MAASIPLNDVYMQVPAGNLKAATSADSKDTHIVWNQQTKSQNVYFIVSLCCNNF